MISSDMSMVSLISIEEAQEFLFAYTELSTDAVSSQFASSDEPTNGFGADAQAASDRGNVVQGDWLSGRQRHLCARSGAPIDGRSLPARKTARRSVL
jgi:hypothetical protein